MTSEIILALLLLAAFNFGCLVGLWVLVRTHTDELNLRVCQQLHVAKALAAIGTFREWKHQVL